MNRIELGERMQQWHSSMGDPIYAVGSYYFAGDRYPVKATVEDALLNLQSDLSQARQMDRGKKIYIHNGMTDLKTFGGFTRRRLRENIKDLREITEALKEFLEKDYA